MQDNRVSAAAFGVLLVGWFMLRHTLGFYVGIPTFLKWEDLVTFLLVLIFTPAVMSKARWTALGAAVVGVIRIIAGLYGLHTAPTSKAWGPAVPVILALIFAYFSFRAYQQK